MELNMATKITRIKASDDGPKSREDKDEEVTRKVSVKAAFLQEKTNVFNIS